MQQNSANKKNYKKLKIGLLVLALLVAGFFIYKYAYIYSERRKYDQAAVAINKVADDLRAQGISTEFSRGCGRTQVVYGQGTAFCAVSVKYDGGPRDISSILVSFSDSASTHNFSLVQSNGVNFSETPIRTGDMIYKLGGNPMQCTLTYSTPTDETSRVELSCGKPEKFIIY